MIGNVVFRRTDRSPRPVADDEVFVRESSIQLAWWRGVTVRRSATSELSTVEQFVLEAAQAFGTLETVHFTTITGLPANVFHAAARRLVNARALTPTTAGDSYVVAPQAAASVLAKRAVPIQKTAKLDFVYLPVTDDLVCLGKCQSTTLDDLYHSRTFHQAKVPAPEPLRSAPIAQFLGQRVRERAVAGLPGDVSDVEAVPGHGSNRPPAHHVCLVYQCSGVARRRGQHQPALELSLHHAAQSTAHQRPTDPATIDLPFPPGTNLASKWLAMADAAGARGNRHAFWSAVAAGLARCPADGPTRTATSKWTYAINGLTATALLDLRHNLTGTMCIDILTDDTVAESTVRFTPTDPHSTRLMTVDRAISHALRDEINPDPLIALIRSSAQRGSRLPSLVTHESILDRLWQLRAYQLAYALTGPLDFPYA